MWWLTSTTGASAHWPKQATVRTVKRRSAVVSASLSASLFSSASRSLRPRSRQSLSEQIARAARVAGRSAADADHVVALRIEIEERIKRGGAVDSCRRNAGLRRRCSAAHSMERNLCALAACTASRIPSSAPGWFPCLAMAWSISSRSCAHPRASWATSWAALWHDPSLPVFRAQPRHRLYAVHRPRTDSPEEEIRRKMAKSAAGIAPAYTANRNAAQKAHAFRSELFPGECPVGTLIPDGRLRCA